MKLARFIGGHSRSAYGLGTSRGNAERRGTTPVAIERVRNCMKVQGLQGCDKKQRSWGAVGILRSPNRRSGFASFSASSGPPPHPECFAERGSKLLKTKGWSAEKSAKRGTRGSKLLRTWDLPQRHGDTEGLNKRIAPPPPVFL